MKILNLYAGIGGNRKLWGDKHEITAVENNPYIASIYSRFFPRDKVIVTDAHQFLLDHYKEFDLIWASPPCPTHSIINFFLNAQGIIRYPDMTLYQEIIFLKSFFKGLFIIENVKPYYDLLIKPSVEIDRHLFWCNFPIKKIEFEKRNFQVTNAKGKYRLKEKEYIQKLQEYHGFNLEGVKYKVKLLRNCVNPKIGEYLLNEAINYKL